MNTTPLPLKIKIASPCSARWMDMKGDAHTRFCEHCSKHVYDLSGMSAEEAVALFKEKEGRMCVRVFQRADGTVLHGNDCPVGVARYRQRMRAFWGAGVSAMVLMFAHARAYAASETGTDDIQSRAHSEAVVQAAKESLQFQLSVTFGCDPKGPTMGDLVPVHTPPPTPSPSPIPHRPAE